METRETEIWKNVSDYPGYQISNFGRLKSLSKEWKTGEHYQIIFRSPEKIMKTSLNNWGYLWARISKKGKKRMFLVHIEVAKAFINNPENKPQVNHKDGNKLNNNWNNLEWNTVSENTQHAYDTGLAKGAQGEKSGSAKLKNEDVLEIRRIAENGKYGVLREIAKKYGIAASVISRIVNRKIWKHI